MRAVLDENVLISGLLWPGIPQLCILAADAGLYELVVIGVQP
jgi:predicted nucleic acid-binding protein